MSWVLLVPALLAPAGVAKSYYFPEISTQVSLQPDGSVRVVQERTYAFSGSFSWAYLDLKKQGATEIRFNRLAMMTDEGWQEVRPQELTDTDKSLYIRWGYSAEDEQRVFLFDYTILGAVRRYSDVAEFYWKVIEDEHEKVGHATIDIMLPGVSNLLKVYVHSVALPGRLELAEPRNRAVVTQAGIPKNAFVEVRVLSDPDLYPQTVPVAQMRHARILAEERQNFVAWSVRKYVMVPLGLLLLIPLPVVLLLLLWLRFGREPKLDYEAVYEHEPPRKAPPLAVPFIMHQKPDKSAMSQELFRGMMATLLDLARQGIVSVNEVREGRKTKYEFRLDKPDKLQTAGEFERLAADCMFGKFGGGGNMLTEEMLKGYGKSHPNEVKAMLGQMFETGQDWWPPQLGVSFTDAASRKAYTLFRILAVVCCLPGAWLFVTGLATIAQFQSDARLPVTLFVAVAFAALYFLLGRVILRWDPTAYLEHKRWRNFRKFLRDFSAIEQAPVKLLAIWEHYYVYAVVLGVAEEFLKNIARLSEQQGTSMALPVWYVAAAGTRGAGMASLADSLAGFQSFGANLSSLMSSFSTASTSGGGFSGGGGGGGGGGSSGAG
jgi:uncharacterized membrane protein